MNKYNINDDFSILLYLMQGIAKTKFLTDTRFAQSALPLSNVRDVDVL